MGNSGDPSYGTLGSDATTAYEVGDNLDTYDWSTKSPYNTRVTIMHLANAGAILINKGSYEQGGVIRKKQVDDYYLTRVPQVELSLNSTIDRKAMSFLFDTVAQGQPSLWLGTIKAYAESNPEEFNKYRSLLLRQPSIGKSLANHADGKGLRREVRITEQAV